MFGGHRPYEKEDIKFSTCHVTLGDHVIRKSCDIMSEFPSSQVTTLPSLVVRDLAAEGMFCF